VVGQLEALRVRVGPALGVPRVFELGPGELAGLVDRDDVSPLGPPSRLVSRLLLGGGRLDARERELNSLRDMSTKK
jgi:hypothetical protein